MSIRLVQWEDSTVTPTNDRIIYDNGYNGIIEGCAITSLGLNMLHIGDGYVRILGGLIEIVGQDIEVETSASGNKKGQLWIRLDLGSSTPVEFMTEAATTLSTLTQNAKANFENGVYEFQLCTYDISETTISNLAITAESAPSIKALFNDVVTAANESETSSTTPRDADLLGGHAPSYFATNDSLSKNNFDTQVSIASYTSDDKYTAPNDGYVRAYVQKASSGYVHVRAESANGNGNYTQFTLVANDQTSSMNTFFVKKGMKLYIAGSSGTYTVVFNALI